MSDWSAQFAIDHEMYVKSTEAIQTIKSNVFDDDLIERSLVDLRNLWKKSPKSRQMIIVEFGYVDTLLGCLKNADEGVVLNACLALEVLLTPASGKDGVKTVENLIDVMVRHGAMTSISTQIRVEGNTDIKKAALKLLTKFLNPSSSSLKQLVQDEIKRQKIVSYCAS